MFLVFLSFTSNALSLYCQLSLLHPLPSSNFPNHSRFVSILFSCQHLLDIDLDLDIAGSGLPLKPGCELLDRYPDLSLDLDLC